MQEDKVASVWECEPFTCTHNFSVKEKYLICREILYVSDHATRSHYKLSHPYNRGKPTDRQTRVNLLTNLQQMPSALGRLL